MNTAFNGSGRVDDDESHSHGEIRGPTKLVEITENVREYAAEQGMSDDEALQRGMEQKVREFTEARAEIYQRPKGYTVVSRERQERRLVQ